MQTLIKSTIESYSFGKMTIGERQYTSDLIVFPDGHVQPNWWRKEGHNLLPEDISAVLEETPALLIIGTGHNGVMTISDAVMEICQQRGIQLESAPTPEAIVLYNRAAERGESVAGCFHLTC